MSGEKLIAAVNLIKTTALSGAQSKDSSGTLRTLTNASGELSIILQQVTQLENNQHSDLSKAIADATAALDRLITMDNNTFANAGATAKRLLDTAAKKFSPSKQLDAAPNALTPSKAEPENPTTPLVVITEENLKSVSTKLIEAELEKRRNATSPLQQPTPPVTANTAQKPITLPEQTTPPVAQQEKQSPVIVSNELTGPTIDIQKIREFWRINDKLKNGNNKYTLDETINNQVTVRENNDSKKPLLTIEPHKITIEDKSEETFLLALKQAAALNPEQKLKFFCPTEPKEGHEAAKRAIAKFQVGNERIKVEMITDMTKLPAAEAEAKKALKDSPRFNK